MAEKAFLTVEDQQKLKLLLKVIDDAGELDKDQEDASKAKDCIGEKEIQRVVDLGLGRGVDATDPTPWLNKTSFQARPVTMENIIGTEEGGCVQSYEREITSTSETRGRASASVTDPKTAVTIGVEAEYSLSASSRYRVIGTKVLNRTISFKEHSDDATITLKPDTVTFDQWLCRWMLNKKAADIGSEIIKLKRQVIEDKKNANTESVALKENQIKELESQLTQLNAIQTVESSQDKPQGQMEKKVALIQMFKQYIEDEEIIEYCNRFITQFHITHYVSSIQLGASGYEVLTESRIARRLGLGSRVGVEKIAAGTTESSHTKSHRKNSSDVNRIGVIELKNNIPTVRRGSHQEAVVGIQVKPISDLVNVPELRGSLQKALVQYTRSEGDTCGEWLDACMSFAFTVSRKI